MCVTLYIYLCCARCGSKTQGRNGGETWCAKRVTSRQQYKAVSQWVTQTVRRQLWFSVTPAAWTNTIYTTITTIIITFKQRKLWTLASFISVIDWNFVSEMKMQQKKKSRSIGCRELRPRLTDITNRGYQTVTNYTTSVNYSYIHTWALLWVCLCV